MEHPQARDAVERAIVHVTDVATVEIEHLQLLLPDELVASELAQLVPIQVDGGRVHRDVLGHLRVVGGPTVHDVRLPRVVVVAAAPIRARHLAVARIEVTAVARGEAVRLVAAEEIVRSQVHQRPDAGAPLVLHRAHHRVEVHDARVLPQVGQLVDALQPLHRAVAVDRIVAEVELGDLARIIDPRQCQCANLQLADVVPVQHHLHQVALVQERAGGHLLQHVVVEEERLDAVRDALAVDGRQPVERHVQHLDLQVVQVVVVAQLADVVLVHVEPLERRREVAVVEHAYLVVRHVEEDERRQRGEHAANVLQLVVVQPDGADGRVRAERRLVDVADLVRRQVEHVQRGERHERVPRDVGDAVLHQPQPEQLLQALERRVVNGANAVLAEIERLQEAQLAQPGRDLRQPVVVQVEVVQVGEVLQGAPVHRLDRVRLHVQLVEHV
uniref:Uncharacterized protein n=1 Tax=Anopheles atroparvus TaxID=41427 RepID=A0AAG5DQ93_ANOAO